MLRSEAHELVVGDRVRCVEKDGNVVEGTVVKVYPGLGLRVQWDDDVAGTYNFATHDFSNMTRLELGESQ